jgi:predicted dehydrogenase
MTVTGAGPARYAIIGTGFRAEFFLRLATDLPERFDVTSVYSRSEAKRAEIAQRFGVRAAASVDEAATLGNPEFVIVAVPWPVAPEISAAIAERGVAVLEETPPAPDVEAMRELWHRVGHLNLIQVAEHTPYMPAHLARLRITRDGLIGDVTSVQVSSNHQYHAISIMRGLLNAGRRPASIVARTSANAIVEPVTSGGVYTNDPTPISRPATLALIDFGDGKTAVYDFTEFQWWNPLRRRRLTVRGTAGEINDEHMVHLEDPRTVLESVITRRQTGIDMNLEGFALDNISVGGRAVYRNPFGPARQSDEDIAAATLVERTSLWVRDEAPAPYPLADGLQDHLIGLAIEEAARTGLPVTTDEEAWAKAGGPEFLVELRGERRA